MEIKSLRTGGLTGAGITRRCMRRTLRPRRLWLLCPLLNQEESRYQYRNQEIALTYMKVSKQLRMYQQTIAVIQDLTHWQQILLEELPSSSRE